MKDRIALNACACSGAYSSGLLTALVLKHDKINALEKTWKLEANDLQNDKAKMVDFRISAVFLQTFLHVISPSNRTATQSMSPCEPRQQ